MDWESLRFFLHVARTGSVSAAARLLGVDHSTVSRRVADLEAGIGMRLFDRAGRRLRINAAGEQLYRTAERIESLLLQEAPQKSAKDGQIAGTVRIGAPEGFGVGYLGRRLGLLTRDYPEIELELVALPQNYSLAAREVDIAITLDRPRAGSVATRKLTDYTLLLYGSRDYLGRQGRPASVSELSSHAMVGYIRPLLHTATLNYRELRRLDPAPPARLRSTSIIAQMEAVSSGAAIGVLPCFLVGDAPDLLPVLRDEIVLRRSYWLSIHDDLRQVARIKAIGNALGELVRRDRRLFAGS